MKKFFLFALYSTTLRGNNMKQSGVTKPNQLERIAALEKNAETVSMGVRVSQMLVQQMMGKVQELNEKLHVSTAMINDLQYRLLAVQKVSGLDLNSLQKEADRLKLEEWTKASDEDSASRGLLPAAEVASQNSVVVFTSTTPESQEDKGIFRSKVKVLEIGSTEAAAAFYGKKPGDKFDIVLADTKHVVELLQVLEEPKEV
jgi:hypothetical protein